MKPIIFLDLDGPLLTISDRYYALYLHLMDKFNKNVISKEAYWELKKNKATTIDILSKTNAGDIVNEYLHERLRIIETEEFLQYNKLIPNTSEILSELAKDYLLVIVTLRNNRTLLLKELEKFGLMKYFTRVLSSGEDIQPRWKIKFNLISENFPDKKNRFLMVGDTETDILAGKNLKMLTIGVLSGIRSREILLGCAPDFIIDDINTLHQIIKEINHGSKVCRP